MKWTAHVLVWSCCEGCEAFACLDFQSVDDLLAAVLSLDELG